MKKKELIDYCNAIKENKSQIINCIDVNGIIKKIEQLDESEKVTVSEEEAKFLETFDFNCESDVTTALYLVSRTGWGYYLRDNNGEELKDLSEEFRELENRKRLIRAILFGYVVEKEKRYEVILCNGQSLKTVYRQGDDYLDFEKVYGDLENFTRKQLEDANFGWVFDCPGIEVEEVEE